MRDLKELGQRICENSLKDVIHKFCNARGGRGRRYENPTKPYKYFTTEGVSEIFNLEENFDLKLRNLWMTLLPEVIDFFDPPNLIN